QCLRQRTGRDNQRSVQNGSDSPQGALENQGRRGTGHPGMGVLVQPSTPAGIDRRHPPGRSRRKVLSTTCSTRCGTCFTLTKQPPRFPVRFNGLYGLHLEVLFNQLNKTPVELVDVLL